MKNNPYLSKGERNRLTAQGKIGLTRILTTIASAQKPFQDEVLFDEVWNFLARVVAVARGQHQPQAANNRGHKTEERRKSPCFYLRQ